MRLEVTGTALLRGLLPVLLVALCAERVSGQAGPDRFTEPRSYEGAFSRAAPEVAVLLRSDTGGLAVSSGVLSRVDRLKALVLDALIDPLVRDKAVEIGGLVTEYQTGRSALALPAIPKSLRILAPPDNADGHGAHAPLPLHPQVASEPGEHERAWLTLAIFEVLLSGKRSAISAEVLPKYKQFLEGGRQHPVSRPTSSAIAPELAWQYPELAVIIDNASLLEEGLSRIAVDSAATDKAAASAALVAAVQEPGHMAITLVEWAVESLRPGIYAQGGPARGHLEQSERNSGISRADHRTLMPPGPQ